MGWVQSGIGMMSVLGCIVVGFFFVTTGMSVAIARYFNIGDETKRHIYPIYRVPWLVWLTDRRFVVSTVLLFQYDRLVDAVLGAFGDIPPGRGRVLQVACVSGDITEKLVSRFRKSADVFILDASEAGIRNSRKKLESSGLGSGAEFIHDDATSMPFRNGSFDFVLSFFLFHELPAEKKKRVFRECLRLIRPGGVFAYAEFHRPKSVLLRILGRTVFGLFEPYAREMWRWNPCIDPKRFEVRRTTILHGYFQVVSIIRKHPDISG